VPSSVSLAQSIRAEAAAALNTLSFDQNVPKEIVESDGLRCIVEAISGGTDSLSEALIPGAPVSTDRQVTTKLVLAPFALGE
jgi:hypothetical protein